MTDTEKEEDNETPEVAEDQLQEVIAEDTAQESEVQDGDGAGPGQTAEKTPEEEVAELKDRLLRALAENENLIRRGRRDREDALQYAATNFARDMLGVADNMARALASVPELEGEAAEAVNALLEGVKLTEKELASTLERHGIVRISPMGEKFDHDRHEALFEVPTAEAEPGTVMQVVEDGYMIHDRLLRAARVGVAKAPDAAPGNQPRELDTEA